MSLKNEMNDWIKRYLSRGNKMVKYQCPHCKGFCYSVILDPGQVHDSMTTCPECEKPHFRFSLDDMVRASIPGENSVEVETTIIDKDSFKENHA